MANLIRTDLIKFFDAVLIDELLSAYADAKRNFHSGGLRLSAVEGGRFCEAALRILQQRTRGTFDPIGTSLDSEKTIRDLSMLPTTAQPDSIRLHIPRSLRVVYDIRNKRDIAHLADGIDPNLQDATLVISILDWVLAEFVRLFHSVSADLAHKIVNDLVTRATPVVEEFDGFLKVLRTDLRAGDFCLVLLYQRGAMGAAFDEIENWISPTMRPNLKRTLITLVNDKALLHYDSKRFFITQTGLRYVEQQRLSLPRN